MAGDYILVVDDDPAYRQMLQSALVAAGYAPLLAASGKEALAQLRTYRNIGVVLLDHTMQGMDGLEVLRRIKAQPELATLPVILLSALVSHGAEQESIRAGAYYCLPKPYNPSLLLSVLAAAVEDGTRLRTLNERLASSHAALGLMQEAHFRFRTQAEGENLAVLLAQFYPEPENALIGLNELFINAVEHGNLGISFDEKAQLLHEGTWPQVLERKMSEDHLSARRVSVAFAHAAEGLYCTIADEGEGFDWRPFMEGHTPDIERLHGRGITLARTLSFETMQYNQRGNTVYCGVSCAQQDRESGTGRPGAFALDGARTAS